MPARLRLTFAAMAALVAVVAVVVLAGTGDPSGRADRSAPGAKPAPRADSPRGSTASGRSRATEDAGSGTPVSPVRVRDGEPVGGVRTLVATKGRRIRFTVTSDVADHVHLHGYDVMRDVGPGRPARFDLRATITGVFEAELEDRGVPVVTLRVTP